jgi:hypothetical protein
MLHKSHMSSRTTWLRWLLLWLAFFLLSHGPAATHRRHEKKPGTDGTKIRVFSLSCAFATRRRCFGLDTTPPWDGVPKRRARGPWAAASYASWPDKIMRCPLAVYDRRFHWILVGIYKGMHAPDGVWRSNNTFQRPRMRLPRTRNGILGIRGIRGIGFLWIHDRAGALRPKIRPVPLRLVTHHHRIVERGPWCTRSSPNFVGLATELDRWMTCT